MYEKLYLGCVAVILASFLLVTCANTPTVPVPPPDATVVTTVSPDLEGFVDIVGGVGAAEDSSVVLVFNQRTESGVMETAAENGSFSARLEADIGDWLLLQVKRDDSLSEEVFIEVK